MLHKIGTAMQKIENLIRVITTAACLMVVISCSPTNINAVWKDPQYQGGKIKNVLVIGGSTNKIIRRSLEDEFVAKLKTRGTSAIQSYNIFPAEATLDQDTIESKSRDLGVDAMLVVRIVDTKVKRDLTPQPYNVYYRGTYFYDWPNRYSRFYTQGSRARYYDDRYYRNEYEVVNVETNLFDVQTGKLIWSGLSDTVIGGSSELEITSLVEVIMKSLTENQLL
jgi:hypothetical protein